MGSRTTSTITRGYGRFTGTRSTTLSLTSQASINQAYQTYKLQADNDFQSSLSSFSQRMATNAAKTYLLLYFPVVGDIYHAYLFAKIMYDYYTKVRDEYARNAGDLNSDNIVLYLGRFELEV